MATHNPHKSQKGGFIIGLIVGLLIGLALALGVALYVTKVPVPFINKVPQRTAEQDAAEARKNRDWDPNAPLASRPAQAASGAVTPSGTPSTRDPAALLAGGSAGAASVLGAASGFSSTTTVISASWGSGAFVSSLIWFRCEGNKKAAGTIPRGSLRPAFVRADLWRYSAAARPCR